MDPNNRHQGGDAQGPAPYQSPSNSPQEGAAQPHDQQAAAHILRSQIDALYENQPTDKQVVEPATPYQRSHTPHPQPQADQWKMYHSAWQEYYQKYYAAYYAQQAPSDQSTAQSTPEFNDAPADISKNQALTELRNKLLGKVRSRATSVRKSRHFIPAIAALAVVLVFVFLQYNRVIIASVNAYVSPGTIDPQNIVIDPSADATVGNEPRLIIPKINVDVPALYDVGIDHDSQMAAMENGVAHFAIPGANSHPGEIGNTVLSGHSSNDLFDAGDYKFIFAQLEKLAIGDTIYAHYEGKRFTYVITKKEVVKPTNVAALIYPTDKPIMTLITCTPLGTALNRLLVTAEQVSPDPAAAAAAPSGSGQQSAEDEAAIPGNSPTLLERIFGAR